MLADASVLTSVGAGTHNSNHHLQHLPLVDKETVTRDERKNRGLLCAEEENARYAIERGAYYQVCGALAHRLGVIFASQHAMRYSVFREEQMEWRRMLAKSLSRSPSRVSMPVTPLQPDVDIYPPSETPRESPGNVLLRAAALGGSGTFLTNLTPGVSALAKTAADEDCTVMTQSMDDSTTIHRSGSIAPLMLLDEDAIINGETKALLIEYEIIRAEILREERGFNEGIVTYIKLNKVAAHAVGSKRQRRELVEGIAREVDDFMWEKEPAARLQKAEAERRARDSLSWRARDEVERILRLAEERRATARLVIVTEEETTRRKVEADSIEAWQVTLQMNKDGMHAIVAELRRRDLQQQSAFRILEDKHRKALQTEARTASDGIFLNAEKSLEHAQVQQRDREWRAEVARIEQEARQRAEREKYCQTDFLVGGSGAEPGTESPCRSNLASPCTSGNTRARQLPREPVHQVDVARSTPLRLPPMDLDAQQAARRAGSPLADVVRTRNVDEILRVVGEKGGGRRTLDIVARAFDQLAPSQRDFVVEMQNKFGPKVRRLMQEASTGATFVSAEDEALGSKKRKKLGRGHRESTLVVSSPADKAVAGSAPRPSHTKLSSTSAPLDWRTQRFLAAEEDARGQLAATQVYDFAWFAFSCARGPRHLVRYQAPTAPLQHAPVGGGAISQSLEEPLLEGSSRFSRSDGGPLTSPVNSASMAPMRSRNQVAALMAPPPSTVDVRHDMEWKVYPADAVLRHIEAQEHTWLAVHRGLVLHRTAMLGEVVAIANRLADASHAVDQRPAPAGAPSSPAPPGDVVHRSGNDKKEAPHRDGEEAARPSVQHQESPSAATIVKKGCKSPSRKDARTEPSGERVKGKNAVMASHWGATGVSSPEKSRKKAQSLVLKLARHRLPPA